MNNSTNHRFLILICARRFTVILFVNLRTGPKKRGPAFKIRGFCHFFITRNIQFFKMRGYGVGMYGDTSPYARYSKLGKHIGKAGINYLAGRARYHLTNYFLKKGKQAYANLKNKWVTPVSKPKTGNLRGTTLKRKKTTIKKNSGFRARKTKGKWKRTH